MQYYKRKNIAALILSVYSPLLCTELHFKVCLKGYGAIILYKQNDAFLKPVPHISKTMTD